MKLLIICLTLIVLACNTAKLSNDNNLDVFEQNQLKLIKPPRHPIFQTLLTNLLRQYQCFHAHFQYKLPICFLIFFTLIKPIYF